MATIAEIRQQLEQSKRQAEFTRQQLASQKQNLPDVRSERALRSSEGLTGRESRRAVVVVEKGIESKQQEVKQFEETLVPVEQQVKEYEASVKDYEARQAAIASVNKAAGKGNVWMLAAYGEGYEKQYAKEWLHQENTSQILFFGDVNKIRATLPPTDKLIISEDVMGRMKVSGVESGGMSVNLENYRVPVTTTPKISSPQDLARFGSSVDTKSLFVKRDLPTVNLPKNIPSVQRGNEVYVSKTNTYISPSQTPSATGYIRTPTPSEQARIDEAAYKGSFVYLGGVAVDKVIMPVTKFVEPVTTYVRNIPNPFSSERNATVGSTVLKLTEGAAKIGTEWKKGIDIGASYLSKKSTEVESKRLGAGISSISTILTGAGYVAKATPTLIQYGGLGVIGGASVDLFALEEKRAKPELYIQEELSSRYKEYNLSYDKELANLKEGFELEPRLTEGEFFKQKYTEVSSQVKRNIEFEYIVPATMLAGGLAFKGYGVVKNLATPKMIEGSLIKSKMVDLSFMNREYELSKITKEGLKNYGSYKLFQATTPTSYLAQSTFGRWFGTEPSLVVVSKGQVYVTQPFINRVTGSLKWFTPKEIPYIAVTSRVGVGGNLVNDRFNLIAGTNVKGTLTNTERYLWGSLISKSVKPSQIIKDTISYTTEDKGLVETYSRGKLFELNTKNFKIKTFETGTIVKPVTVFGSGAGVFKVRTGFKEVTPKSVINYLISKQGKGVVVSEFPVVKSVARASGKINTLDLTLIKLPTLVEEGASVGTIVGGGGSKSSPEFFQQLYAKQVVVPINKPVIKIPKVSVSTKQVFKETAEQVANPYMVVGTGLKEIAYAGQGMYEVSNYDIGLKQIPTAISKTIQVESPITKMDVIQKAVPDLKLREIPKQLPSQRQIPSFKITPIEETIQKQQPQQKQIPRQQPQQKQIPKQPPKPTSIIPLPLLGSSNSQLGKSSSVSDVFEAFVTKKGKDVSIGKRGSQFEAESLLKTRLRGTLAASGLIKRGETKLKATELKTFGGGEFRLSKANKFKIVEKKEQRLRKGTTGKEVQSFRPSRKKRRLF